MAAIIGDASNCSGLFHKTKLCKFNVIGACSKGSSCTFAHGAFEMQPMPDFHCTKLCPALLELGVCSNASCGFAHDSAEIRRRSPTDLIMPRVAKDTVPPPPLPFPGAPLRPRPQGFEAMLVKTKMC
eukprot:1918014-Amphidinium_carterae.1